MALSQNFKDKLLPILVNRTVIFFFIMDLLAILLYAAGTVQGFSDSTQFALLRVFIIFGIFMVVASAYGIFVSLERYKKLKVFRYILRTLFYAFLVIFGLTTVLAANFILTLAAGTAACPGTRLSDV